MKTDIIFHEFEEVDSTNRVLIDMARDGAPCGTVVWAHRQSGGRGRLGRSFSSPEGGVYISFLLPLPKESESMSFTLTAMAGVAVKRTIFQVCNLNCGIKWVNDIIFNGKKVCGILAQAAEDKVVLGIGVNYTTPQSSFPAELRDIACSLYDGSDAAPPMADFVRALAQNIYETCAGEDESWLEVYKSSSTIVGNEVQIIQAGEIVGRGKVIGIDDLCHLHIKGEDGKEIVLSTGEVSIRKRDD
jgi:BirA family biotin operon repressor/biotin-[acetyl-CoA-carboxylase] ligase